MYLMEQTHFNMSPFEYPEVVTWNHFRGNDVHGLGAMYTHVSQAIQGFLLADCPRKTLLTEENKQGNITSSTKGLQLVS
jgi:hypothetical protein